MQTVFAIIFFLFFWVGLLGISLFVTLVLCHEVAAFIMDYRAGLHDPYGFWAGQRKKAVARAHSSENASGAAWR